VPVFFGGTLIVTSRPDPPCPVAMLASKSISIAPMLASIVKRIILIACLYASP
jgi:hypothetical protein